MDEDIIYGFPKREILGTTWLKKQLASGASIADIVRLTGYSSHYICRIIGGLGLKPSQERITLTYNLKRMPYQKEKPIKKSTQRPKASGKKARAVPAAKKRKSIDKDWLNQQIDSGTPIAEIARRAGYSRNGVYYNIRKHNLKIPNKEGINPAWLREQKMQGKTDAQIAEEFSLNPNSIKYYRKKYDIDSFILVYSK